MCLSKREEERMNQMWQQLSRVAVGIGLQAALLSSSAWAYEVIDVKDGGVISGEIKFSGTPPTPEKLVPTKDQEVCGKTEKVNESLLVGANKGIQNVVVSISNIQKGKKMPETGGTLDQKDCRYAPHVVLSPAGTELNIVNSDGILHNIHTSSTKNPPFNKAQPKFKKEMKESFVQPETVKLSCDVHGWMSGWLIVQDTPYYAVTDANGAFKITDVPPGDYDLKLWHETLGETTQKVSVKAKEETKIAAEMAKK
jgi:plastocyanin